MLWVTVQWLSLLLSPFGIFIIAKGLGAVLSLAHAVDGQKAYVACVASRSLSICSSVLSA